MTKQNEPQKHNANGLGGEDEIRAMIEWHNEHGQPDFAFLQSLAQDSNTIEPLEKLRAIAEDLDVGFDPNTSPEDLVARIRSAVAENGDDGFQPTP